MYIDFYFENLFSIGKNSIFIMLPGHFNLNNHWLYIDNLSGKKLRNMVKSWDFQHFILTLIFLNLKNVNSKMPVLHD